MNSMSQAQRLDTTFMALADSTRRAILARLALGEASVAELAEPFAISQPAVSKHLKILERAGLISVGRDAQRRPRSIEAKPLAEASAWLERYREIWETNFARLDTLLEELQAQPAERRRAEAGEIDMGTPRANRATREADRTRKTSPKPRKTTTSRKTRRRTKR